MAFVFRCLGLHIVIVLVLSVCLVGLSGQCVLQDLFVLSGFSLLCLFYMALFDLFLIISIGVLLCKVVVVVIKFCFF